MVARRFERRQHREALPDALLTLAASLHSSANSGEALDELTRRLAERNVACVLLVQPGEAPALRIERATLPLAPDVWGRTLLLPNLTNAFARGRPVFQNDISASFVERIGDGKQRPLLVERVPGNLIVAPLRVDGRPALLCLASRELEDRDRNAAWALALAVGAALSQGALVARPVATPSTGDDLSIFHELTRRLSFSLDNEQVVRAGLEALAPVLGFQLAASVTCRGNEDVTTVYAAEAAQPAAATGIAAGTLDAFLSLTGDKHRDCARPALLREAIAATPPQPGQNGRVSSVLDAPLVINGEIVGLLRIGSAQAGAFDSTKDTFYTVANQISLALERVTAQRQAERAQLASLAESLSDGVVLIDAALRVTALNTAARQHLAGIDDSALAEGASLANTPLADLVRETLRSNAPTTLRELPAAAATTGRRYVMAMAAPLAGSPEGSAAVVILRDVTDERLMQERLLQSEKMVSVGQLVSGVAHELNNPLTGIMGFTQLLLGRDIEESMRRDLDTIYAEADRAAKIVQNLLSFTRRKRAEKELVNLNVLVERVLELRVYDLRVKSIDVELDLDSKLPETMIDANQVQQVILNVIINAEQAMLSAHGRGTLKVRSRVKESAIRLSFQDDGPGMQPETLRRIFDPFFTTKEVGEGTGLGLTISYGIVDEHGGRIWAESNSGRGTTFLIELPIIARTSRPADPTAAEPEPVVIARSILVVDDEESIQRLLGSILEMDGHRVDKASNGREALQRIGRRQYDLIITDIKMPDMGGRDLYKRLLDIDRNLARRTIFITGDTVSADTRSFLQEVDNPCLAKPFRVREVRDTIAAVLSE